MPCSRSRTTAAPARMMPSIVTPLMIAITLTNQAVIAFGLATLVFAVSRSIWLSLLALAAMGAADTVSVVIRIALVQLSTPDEMRGRVGSITGLFIGTSNLLGGFESGAVAGAFGPVFSVVSGAIGTVIVVFAVAWYWPSVRRLGTLASVEPEPIVL